MTSFVKIPKGALIGTEQRPIYGYETVKAVLINGLAVHKSLQKKPFIWTVCHASSGLRVPMLVGTGCNTGRFDSVVAAARLW